MDMKDAIIRLARPGDEPCLKKLWHECFGDGYDYIDPFFEAFYYEGCAAVAIQEGAAASMAMALDPFLLRFPEGDELPCRYLFAVATLPERRGAGLAREVCKKTGANIVCPAEDTLFGYYASMGFEDYFFVDEWETGPGEYSRPSGARAELCTAEEYGRLREAMLSGRTHLVPDARAIGFQGRGGELLSLCGGCAAVERAPSMLYVKELLVPEGRVSEALGLLSDRFGGAAMTVRTPAGGGKNTRRFGQLRPAPGGRFVPKSGNIPYFGFAFD